MTYLAGLGLMLSLIVAIGAQNVFVLRQGIRREHVGIVVAICAASDAALVAAGVSGVGIVVTRMPWLVTGARWAGAAFLLGYAVLAARRALTTAGEKLVVDVQTDPDLMSTPGDQEAAIPALASPAAAESATKSTAAAASTAPVEPRSREEVVTKTLASPLRSVVFTCLALTWLNPHVYLDTLFLVGTVATSHGDARWLFALGAMTGSVIWFVALGYGARLLGRVLSRPRAWRILDGIIAVVMTAMAVMLLVSA